MLYSHWSPLFSPIPCEDHRFASKCYRIFQPISNRYSLYFVRPKLHKQQLLKHREFNDIICAIWIREREKLTRMSLGHSTIIAALLFCLMHAHFDGALHIGQCITTIAQLQKCHRSWPKRVGQHQVAVIVICQRLICCYSRALVAWRKS